MRLCMYLHMLVCMYVCVCMYLCMLVCMNVCVCVHACMCVHVSMYGCVYIRVHVCIYALGMFVCCYIASQIQNTIVLGLLFFFLNL